MRHYKDIVYREEPSVSCLSFTEEEEHDGLKGANGVSTKVIVPTPLMCIKNSLSAVELSHRNCALRCAICIEEERIPI